MRKCGSSASLPYGWIYVDNNLSKGMKTMGLDTAFDED
jgi:hypothetical protein